MQVGDPIVLTLTLWDRNETKFVKVILSGDGVDLPESPVSVPHNVSGEYYKIDKNNLTFPDDVFEVKASYFVYDDAGFTTLSNDYAPAEDKYRLDTAEGSNQISNLVDSLRVLDGEIEVEYDDDEIEVELEVDEGLVDIELEIVI